MNDSKIRGLVLEALRENPNSQYQPLRNKVERLAESNNIGPIGKQENVQIKRVLWDLSVERVISWGNEHTDGDARWPYLHVTPLGRKLLANQAPHFFDPDGYLDFVRSLVESPDAVILEYLKESTRAYRATLDFAAAVMIGAAAERVVLLLLEAIRDGQEDSKTRDDLSGLLDRGRLPAIFDAIRRQIDSRKHSKANPSGIPYSVHQGSETHLFSLFEMIRVHRNEAIHPQAGTVSREKVYLSLSAFPSAYEVTERIRTWFQSSGGGP